VNIEVHLSNGHVVDLLDLPPYEIDLWEICRALSQICRYAGKTPAFYSVAEHSLNLSRYFQVRNDKTRGSIKYEMSKLRRAALVHDFAEAYVGDLIHPIKHTICPSFLALETIVLERVMRALCGPSLELFADKRLTDAHDALSQAELGMFCGDGSALHYADIVTGDSTDIIASRLFKVCTFMGVCEHGK